MCPLHSKVMVHFIIKTIVQVYYTESFKLFDQKAISIHSSIILPNSNLYTTKTCRAEFAIHLMWLNVTLLRQIVTQVTWRLKYFAGSILFSYLMKLCDICNQFETSTTLNTQTDILFCLQVNQSTCENVVRRRDCAHNKNILIIQKSHKSVRALFKPNLMRIEMLKLAF